MRISPPVAPNENNLGACGSALSFHYAEFAGFFAFRSALAQPLCLWPVASHHAAVVFMGMHCVFVGVAVLAAKCGCTWAV